jgi:hypothetical protein
VNRAHHRLTRLKGRVFADDWKAENFHGAGNQIVGWSGRVYTLAVFRQPAGTPQTARIVRFSGTPVQVNPSSVIARSMEP